ncbi:MAG: hypothetical protein QOG64_1376, partial [Acidimicrobiaceae bacterium]|nr:hypothetical protein [Acidimicrobiaceae bacterium]
MSSKTRVALLRGINVGRNKRVAMADLRTLLGSMGYEDVKTHGQSGNALLATSSRSASATIERDIGARIEQDLGLDVQVMVRTVDELEAVMAANPFPGQGVAAKELHVAFLARALPGPKREEVEGLDRNEYRPDQYELGDGVI